MSCGPVIGFCSKRRPARANAVSSRTPDSPASTRELDCLTQLAYCGRTNGHCRNRHRHRDPEQSVSSHAVFGCHRLEQRTERLNLHVHRQQAIEQRTLAQTELIDVVGRELLQPRRGRQPILLALRERIRLLELDRLLRFREEIVGLRGSFLRLAIEKAKELLARCVSGAPLDLRAAMRRPLFVPDTRLHSMQPLALYLNGDLFHYLIAHDKFRTASVDQVMAKFRELLGKQGFDVFYGYYEQTHAHNYFPAMLIRNSERVPMPGGDGVPGRGFRDRPIHRVVQDVHDRGIGRDQALHIGKMAWSNSYRAVPEGWHADERHQWAVGSHDGYAELQRAKPGDEHEEPQRDEQEGELHDLGPGRPPDGSRLSPSRGGGSSGFWPSQSRRAPKAKPTIRSIASGSPARIR